ncbi:MAG: hypothetical protein SPD88_01265 [Candidatus Ventricola sp.]|nr:hypothetical protein [Clostridiales bacterium]MDY4541406.1 hypothetical protein [Candidatus Ventricola sp.]
MILPFFSPKTLLCKSFRHLPFPDAAQQTSHHFAGSLLRQLAALPDESRWHLLLAAVLARPGLIASGFPA